MSLPNALPNFFDELTSLPNALIINFIKMARNEAIERRKSMERLSEGVEMHELGVI